MLWLTVLGVAVAGVTAVLANVPAAVAVLALLCAALAVVRGTDRRSPEVFRARSMPFDVTVLAVAAVALAVLAPAGNLT